MISKRGPAVGAAVTLYLIWVLATWLLEGRILTFQKPGAGSMRFVYTLAANVLVGTVLTMVVIRNLFRSERGLRPSLLGVADPGRIFLGLALGLMLGASFALIQPWPSRDAVVLINAYAQVLPVSTAEVLVCWVLLGGVVAEAGFKPRYITAGLVSAAAFGVYHFGHSPPFNTLKMVGFLSVIGLVTGAFYFFTKSIYGTILFHNFLGTKGVLEALDERHALESFASLRIPLVLTALAVLGIVVFLDTCLVRPAAAGEE